MSLKEVLDSALLLGADYISALPIAFSFACILEATQQGNYLENGLFLFWMHYSNALTYFLKQLPYPKELHPWTFRPEGASNTDVLSRNGIKPYGTPGFPSGHMTGAALFSTYRLLRLWKQQGGGSVKKFINKNKDKVALYIGIILATAWARWYKNCHNITQIIGGTIVGIIQAVIFFEIYNKIIDKK